jgi:hypothetical protein
MRRCSSRPPPGEAAFRRAEQDRGKEQSGSDRVSQADLHPVRVTERELAEERPKAEAEDCSESIGNPLHGSSLAATAMATADSRRRGARRAMG